jgi:hypothetical protein
MLAPSFFLLSYIGAKEKRGSNLVVLILIQAYAFYAVVFVFIDMRKESKNMYVYKM